MPNFAKKFLVVPAPTRRPSSTHAKSIGITGGWPLGDDKQCSQADKAVPNGLSHGGLCLHNQCRGQSSSTNCGLRTSARATRQPLLLCPPEVSAVLLHRRVQTAFITTMLTRGAQAVRKSSSKRAFSRPQQLLRTRRGTAAPFAAHSDRWRGSSSIVAQTFLPEPAVVTSKMRDRGHRAALPLPVPPMYPQPYPEGTVKGNAPRMARRRSLCCERVIVRRQPSLYPS